MEGSRWIRGKAIGTGSFGTVSIAVNKSNGAVFAVKSVDATSSSPAQLHAIENEIRTLRSLLSPASRFVVRYLDDDFTDDHRNLHMEYLPGGNAADLAAAGELEESTLRRYTWCLVKGLNHVHSNGFVHCDVKGKNVLLGTSIAKLADFGSSSSSSSTSSHGYDHPNHNQKIVPRGSPLWMAPEVVRCESQGTESDVWSLGCTVIEMATGSPPWRDEGATTLRRIGYSDEVPSSPERLSDVAKDFLNKCLRRDPARRWSCDRLLQHPFLKNENEKIEIEIFADEPSPRTVFDWPEEEEEEEDDDDDDERDQCVETPEDRIGILATGFQGVNWVESDGWVEVRGFGGEKDQLVQDTNSPACTSNRSGAEKGKGKGKGKGVEKEKEKEEGAIWGLERIETEEYGNLGSVDDVGCTGGGPVVDDFLLLLLVVVVVVVIMITVSCYTSTTDFDYGYNNNPTKYIILNR